MSYSTDYNFRKICPSGNTMADMAERLLFHRVTFTDRDEFAKYLNENLPAYTEEEKKEALDEFDSRGYYEL